MDRIFNLIRLATVIVFISTFLQFTPSIVAGKVNTPLDIETPPPLEHIAAISTGGFHTCALTDSGGVKCWGGRNIYGQLGNGTHNPNPKPSDVFGMTSSIKVVSAGSEHTCAVTTSGGVKCWGRNNHGQLGDGSTIDRLTPVDVVGLASGVIAVEAGCYHTCAVTGAGGAKCWGYNDGGQLGDGTATDSSLPVDVSGLTSGVAMISAGYSHTCVVTTLGGAKCWGRNYLGDGTTTSSSTPVDVSGLSSEVSSITAGNAHTCTLTTSGGVKCWGRNSWGQLGDGTTIDRPIPQDVVGLTSDVLAISSGMFNTCALTEAGTVKCWGDNRDGQLGDGTTEEHHTPVDVIGLPGGVIAIACGGAYWDSAYIHSCALTDSGRVKCWGSNGYLQLGNGDSYSYNHPMDVHALDPDIQFVAPGFEHTCAVTASGGAKCWGDNGSGQLGNATHTDTSLPVDVIGLSSSVKAITAGSYHTCALIGSGQAMCWGSNNYGQLGDGSGSNSPTPVNVYGLDHGVTAVSGGFGHTCAITYLGGVKCWGDNDRGQLGDGTELKQLTPVDVTGLTTGVKAIALGYEHTCALTTNGGVKCWGHNYYGQLGDGTTTDRSTPVDVSGLTSDVTAITTGFNHTCALTSSGKVKCWGYNVEGQLGDRTTTNRSTPVTVNDLTSGIAAITAGGLHTCAMTTYGRVCCWGGNGDGQLGDGSFIEKLTPVTVGGLASGASAIAAGVGYTCTLAGQGRLKCWGSDFSGIVDSPAGQLGLGRIAISSVPVDVVTDEPWLSTNYQAGRPGSFFTLTGQNFPPGGLATITINGQVRFPPMGVDESGWLVFFVDSVGATSGTHTVRVDVSPSTNASTSFELDEGAPWRVQEGGGVKFFLMGGSNRLTFLPVVKR